MAGERRRGGSLNSRGRRPPSSRDSPRSSQSASYESSMYQKDEPSITSSDSKDNRHSHIGGCQHERMVGEGDRYSSSRPSCSHVGGPQHRRMSQDSPVAANSTFERVECCFTVSCIEEGLIQDGATNHNLLQHINSTEEGKKAASFYICPRKTTAPVKRNPSLLSKNKEKQKEQEKRKEQEWMVKGLQIKELSPGMILLKNYLSHSEQVEIIRECHKLGLGQGGFYQPGYSGAKLRFHMMYLGRDWDPETRFYGECHRPSLVRGFYQPGSNDGMKLPFHMMCLGKDWDPETKLYRDRRSVDDAEPPSIPDGFKTMVERSLQDSHDFVRQNSKVRPVEDVLPNMKPDICIVHFYTDKGMLGLHQDKDESLDSLCKGLPVVSLSIGDSADFLYRDDRDADRVKTVKLESGDVLIFGGESRHIFHGVSSIFPGTAPKPLVDETGLRPGRLNLTFWQKEQEKQKEQEQMEKGHQIMQLRSGMILLKNYLGHSEQVEIVRECRELGLGKGGFYQPGYSDRMKFRLQMMCLGKDWDPEKKYRDRRSVDDAEPPSIPDGFKKIVERSLQASLDFIRRNSKGWPMEDELPNMKPDICIVNFYTDKGKFGLHQDGDESQDSLRKGLPVVSFSIGDSAEFLYGDDRDADKVEKVTLESGDVLIFGGKSRHIFHGVPSIFPGTAPKLLLNETGLRTGRLNLTFRQY